LNGTGAAGPATFPSGGTQHYTLDEDGIETRVDNIDDVDMIPVLIGCDPVSIPNGSGKKDEAIVFDGLSAGYIESSETVAFVSPLSVTAWVNMNDLPLAGGVGLIDLANTVFWQVTAAGNIQLGPQDFEATTALGANDVWHLVVMVVDNNGLCSVSVDGGALVPAADSQPGWSATGIVVVGPKTILGIPDGKIDELTIFNNKALSAGEISNIWNGGNGTFYTP
jgi:hypothetical protein